MPACRHLYEQEVQMRSDREWMLAQCSVPTFFARMLRANPDLCVKAMQASGVVEPAAVVARRGCVPIDEWRTCLACVAAAMLLAVISRLPEWLTRMRRREILDRCRV